MIRDAEIRAMLCESLHKDNDGHSYRLLSEFGICDGFARADIVVANGKLCGYEIKSDVDSLSRLKTQIPCYDRTFDYVYLVVGEKLYNAALTVIPLHWGIRLAKQTCSGELIITTKRKPKSNRNVNSMALLELLWHSELTTLLKSHGTRGISGKNRRILRSIAAEKIPLSEIKEYTREIIKSRDGWRVG